MSKETVADIRAELVSLGMTQKEANAIKGKSNLVEARDDMRASVIDIEEDYEVEYPEDEGVEVSTEDAYEVTYEDEAEDAAIQVFDQAYLNNGEYEVEYEDIDTEEESDSFHKEVRAIEEKIVDASNIQLGGPEWQEYVMGLFTEEELIPNPDDKEQRIPCLAGLSRVASSIYKLNYSGPVAIETGYINNHPSATVTYRIEAEYEGRTYIAAAVGDAWIGSMDPQNPKSVYNRYPAAIAESRAESRALKKLLHLRNVPSYEEISRTGEANSYHSPFFDESIDESPLEINDTQKMVINQKSKQFGIDVFKLINKPHFVNPEENPEILFDSIDDLPYNVASQIVIELSAYQSATEEGKEIPKEILL